MKNLSEEERDYLTMLKIEIGTLAACLGFVLGYVAHMYLNPALPAPT